MVFEFYVLGILFSRHSDKMNVFIQQISVSHFGQLLRVCCGTKQSPCFCGAYVVMGHKSGNRPSYTHHALVSSLCQVLEPPSLVCNPSDNHTFLPYSTCICLQSVSHESFHTLSLTESDNTGRGRQRYLHSLANLMSSYRGTRFYLLVYECKCTRALTS